MPLLQVAHFYRSYWGGPPAPGPCLTRHSCASVSRIAFRSSSSDNPSISLTSSEASSPPALLYMFCVVETYLGPTFLPKHWHGYANNTADLVPTLGAHIRPRTLVCFSASTQYSCRLATSSRAGATDVFRSSRKSGVSRPAACHTRRSCKPRRRLKAIGGSSFRRFLFLFVLLIGILLFLICDWSRPLFLAVAQPVRTHLYCLFWLTFIYYDSLPLPLLRATHVQFHFPCPLPIRLL